MRGFKMSLKLKNSVKVILFVLLLACVYKYVDGVLQKKESSNSNFNRFYHLKKNVLDVVFIGSSRLYCDINPVIVWKEKGILSFDLGASGQQFLYSYYYIKESLKYQKPKVIVLETCASIYNGLRTDIGDIYANTCGLRMLKDKIDMVRMVSPDNYMDFLFEFPIYHSRKDLVKVDFVDPYKIAAYPNGFRNYVEINSFEMPQVSDVTDTDPIQIGRAHV
jgi:hypothetical protein